MKPSERKIIGLFVAFLLVLGAVVVRLFDLQIVHHAMYTAMAQDQQVFFASVPGKRGVILDRYSRPLAMTLPAYQVFADPETVTDADKAAAQLAALGLGDRNSLLAKLTKDKKFVWIHRALDVETTLKLKDLGIDGLHFEASGKRARPMGDMALNVIGHVSVDDSALGGVEQMLDPYLRGKPGIRRYFRDALGKERPCVEAVVTTPVSGCSAILTIDSDLQEAAEAELDSTVAYHKAKGGCVVIVDPHTGDILALASNPREWNFPVRYVFEPGSAFKLCTPSTGLELGKVDTLTVMDTYGGCLPVAGGRPIKDDHPGGVMDLREAVRRSSNVYFALVARRIGKRDFYKYMHSFGFGLKTGLGLEGESKGLLKEPGQWSGRTLETMGMGQEVGVTAIQMAMAYAAAANGGKLYRPRLVKTIVDEAGNVKKTFEPRVVRTVLNEETAEIVAGLLRRVVDAGTGQQAKIKGVSIAGKTGTGQKAIDGVYADGKYCPVFAGYLPAENPTMVCVVVVDEPAANGYYGGTVCAPAFKRVIEYALRRDKTLLPAQCYNLDPRTQKQPGASAVAASAGGPKDKGEEAKRVRTDVYPSVMGLSLREAAEALGKAQVKWRAFGSGVVVEQRPAAETPLDAKRVCHLVLGEAE
ncbi:MAG: penicillin-binding transpeptidase domain-containing protein [bacterium]